MILQKENTIYPENQGKPSYINDANEYLLLNLFCYQKTSVVFKDPEFHIENYLSHIDS